MKFKTPRFKAPPAKVATTKEKMAPIIAGENQLVVEQPAVVRSHPAARHR